MSCGLRCGSRLPVTLCCYQALHLSVFFGTAVTCSRMAFRVCPQETGFRGARRPDLRATLAPQTRCASDLCVFAREVRTLYERGETGQARISLPSCPAPAQMR